MSKAQHVSVKLGRDSGGGYGTCWLPAKLQVQRENRSQGNTVENDIHVVLRFWHVHTQAYALADTYAYKTTIYSMPTLNIHLTQTYPHSSKIKCVE